jgi:UDP-GlcNAc:undecaprenyl-phosphate GlcNAc-1-phosphate transferase
MNLGLIICCGLAGMAIVFVLVPLIIKQSQRSTFLQRARDLHHTNTAPVPRLGGIALAAAFIGVEIFIAIWAPQNQAKIPGHTAIIISSLAMFALGLWDDIKPLGARRKLLGQIAIASAVYFAGLGIQKFKLPFTGTVVDLGAIGFLGTVIWLVAMTNLINLIDGIDGLAGGICLMLMALLAYVGHKSGNFELLVAGMAGALLGFLWFNFPPARIYLGDGGAYFLGFQIGLFSLVSSQKGNIMAAMAAPLFVLALPIVDTGLAILRRGLRGLPIFRPDRRHLHHHLLASGMSRRRVVLSFYAVTLVFLLMGFAAFLSRGQLVPILLGIAALVLLLCAGKLRFSRGWFSVGRVVGNSLGMRQEVQYALSLTRWFALEGARCTSIESLWSDLIFAARKLGFSYVKLTLADGERLWQAEPGAEYNVLSVQHELQSGRCGILELKAPGCPLNSESRDTARCRRWGPSTAVCPCIADGRLFQILAELLAEAWTKAVSPALPQGQAPLAFATPMPRFANSLPLTPASCPAPAAASEPVAADPVAPLHKPAAS